MASAGTITVDFAAETAKFTAELKKVNDKLSGMQKGFKDLESIAKGALGFLSVNVFTSFITSSLAAADALGDVADQIGISVTALSQLQFAAQESDLEIDQLNKSLIKMSNNVSDAFNGVDTAQKALKAFGLTAGELRGLKLEDQLARIADQFSTVVDPADRVRVATDLFGKGAETLIPLLLKGSAGLRDFAAEADRLGISLEENGVKRIDRATKVLEKFALMAKRATANIAGSLLEQFVGTDDEGRIIALTEKVKELQKIREEQGGRLSVLQQIDLDKTIEKLGLLQKEINQTKALGDAQIAAAQQAAAAKQAAEAASITTLPDETFGPGFNAQDQLNFEIELDDALIAEQIRVSDEISKIIADAQQRDLDIISQGRQDIAGTEDFWRKYAEDQESTSQARQNRIQQDGLNAAQALYTAFGGKYKKFGQALLVYEKAKAVANIVIETQEAASKALGTYGYPFGLVPAAAAIAFGAARVGVVASTFIGGSSSPSLGSVANPVFTNNTNTSLNREELIDVQSQTSNRGTIEVHIEGPWFDTRDTAQWLTDTLKDAFDRDVVIINSNSAQAQHLIPT